ncbi:hypothetical protein D3C84_1016190 [compost metagenome]
MRVFRKQCTKLWVVQRHGGNALFKRLAFAEGKAQCGALGIRQCLKDGLIKVAGEQRRLAVIKHLVNVVFVAHQRFSNRCVDRANAVAHGPVMDKVSHLDAHTGRPSR